MSAKIVLVLAAVNGFFAVGLGAFGAHGLKNKIATNLFSAYETAVQYHFYHTLALFGVGLLLLHYGQKAWFQSSALLFLVGILLFCGSLYGMALGGPRWFGPITPVGGVFFLVAWASLIVGVLKQS